MWKQRVNGTSCARSSSLPIAHQTPWSERKALLYVLWTVIISPFGKVRFLEGYVGDILTRCAGRILCILGRDQFFLRYGFAIALAFFYNIRVVVAARAFRLCRLEQRAPLQS